MSRTTAYQSILCVAAALATLLSGGGSVAAAQEKQADTVTLSTTEWPPYTGEALDEGGAVSQVIREAFAQNGYQVRVIYRSWPRSIEMARKGLDDVVAYYPGYHCRHRDGFVASEMIARSPLGFAEHVDAPLVWDSLDDIGERKLKIGVVRGYTNTDEFDAKAGMGWIHAIASDDDARNLRKLLRKRIDAAVVDKVVLQYLTGTDEVLKTEPDALLFNRKPLEEKSLYLCFRDDSEGRRLMGIFNAGLAGLDSAGSIESYVTRLVGR